MGFEHIPVLLNETVDSLNIREDGIYVDGTLGGAGHSYEIASRLASGGRLIGFDQDEEAIEASKERLSCFSDRVTFIRSNFRFIPDRLKEIGIDKVDGVMMDLGVSSHQLDIPERGFSYRFDAPLDMRMDQRQEKTAADLLNNESEREIANIIKKYGEERFANNIARNVVKERIKAPIRTTFELNEIIKKSIPAKYRATGGHPSKRTFQALRIALNDELGVLTEVIPDIIELLSDGGRFSIITFHSLEDRIVKDAFRKAENPCTCPPDFPVCVCGNVSKGKVITRKAIAPSEAELEGNSRSASAKLRVFERRYN